MDYGEETVKQIVADLRKFVTAGTNLEHKGLAAVSTVTRMSIALRDGTLRSLDGTRKAITDTIDRLAQFEPKDLSVPRLSRALAILFGHRSTGVGRDVRDRKIACNRYYYPDSIGEAKYEYDNFDRRLYPKLLEALAHAMIEWDKEHSKQVQQIEVVSLVSDGAEAIAESWSQGFWLLFWLNFHLEEALGSFALCWKGPLEDEEYAETLGRALFHMFIAEQAVRNIIDVDEGRFSFLHIGPRMEVERIYCNQEFSVKLFSTEDEEWLHHFLSHQPRNAVIAYRQLIEEPGGRLVFERFRVLAEHCPCNDDDIRQWCLKHFLLSTVPRLRQVINHSWITAGNLGATYFGARMTTITTAELWRPKKN